MAKLHLQKPRDALMWLLFRLRKTMDTTEERACWQTECGKYLSMSKSKPVEYTSATCLVCLRALIRNVEANFEIYRGEHGPDSASKQVDSHEVRS